MERVKDKVAVITGAAQGIGRGCAELLAREGASVVIGDIQDGTGKVAVAEIEAAGGKAHFQHTDVLQEESCAALIQSALDVYGRIDILVNNVGWYPRATLEETTTEFWDHILNMNLRSAFYCCKYAIPAMKHSSGGSIINIGSISGIQGGANMFAYSVAKGGLLTLTRTLAGAHARDHIRMNYLIPGWVLTEGEIALHESMGVPEEELRSWGSRLSFGRHQNVRDIAFAVVYLASDESSQMTGTTFPVDAGLTTLPMGIQR